MVTLRPEAVRYSIRLERFPHEQIQWQAEDGTRIVRELKGNDGSEPAFRDHSGFEVWANRKGQLHREDGPAFIHPGVSEQWYFEGKWHREDGPAIIMANGIELWYHQGVRHREGGPAEKGPAGEKWWVQGQRIDFPDGAWEFVEE